MPTGGAGGGDGGSGGGAPTHEVTVTVVDADGTALEGVIVFASEATGALADDGATDEAGLATVSVPSGGLVSVAVERTIVDWSSHAASQLGELKSFALTDDVSTLLVRVAASQPLPAQNDPMNLELDVAAMPGADEIRLYASCSDDVQVFEGSNSIQGYRGCPGDTTFDLLVVALDADQDTVGYAVLEDVPFTPGTTSPLSASLVAPVDWSWDVEGASGDVLSVGYGIFGAPFGKAPIWASITNVNAPSASESGTIAVADGVPGLLCTLVGTYASSGAGGKGSSLRRCPQAKENLTWNAGRLAPISITESTAGVEVTMGSGEAGDAIVAQLTWDAPNGDSRVSILVMPPTATFIPRLEVPASASTFAPSTSSHFLTVSSSDILSGDDVLTSLAGSPYERWAFDLGLDSTFADAYTN